MYSQEKIILKNLNSESFTFAHIWKIIINILLVFLFSKKWNSLQLGELRSRDENEIFPSKNSFSQSVLKHQYLKKIIRTLSNNPSFYAWGIFGLLGLTWGSSYILIKRGLIAFSAEQVACIRISLSALAFLPFFLLRINKVDWSKWKALIVVGFAGSFFPAFLFATAQTELSSSVTGVLSSLTPLFTLLWGVSLFGVAFNWLKVAGVLLGLFGATLLIFFNQKIDQTGSIWYGILVVIATGSYGLSSNTVKTYLQEMSTLTISAVSFEIIGIPAIIYLSTTNFLFVLKENEQAWSSLGYLMILSLAGTVLATILFFKLVQIKNALFASMVSYMVPLVALLWGVLDREIIVPFHLIGMGLILAGVYISRK